MFLCYVRLCWTLCEISTNSMTFLSSKEILRMSVSDTKSNFCKAVTLRRFHKVFGNLITFFQRGGLGGGLSERLVRWLLSPTICALISLCSLFKRCQKHKHLNQSKETNTWHLTWHKLLMAAIHYLGIINEKKTLTANLDFLSASFTSTLHLHLYWRKLSSVSSSSLVYFTFNQLDT